MATLASMASAAKSATDRRLLSEYGAVFATVATPPPVLVFRGSAEVEGFQKRLEVKSALVGEHVMRLQARAMDALLNAVDEAANAGIRITARAEDSGARCYDDTVRLWHRNVTRGLDHWVEAGRITGELAQQINLQDPAAQIPQILELEDEQRIFFGTFFDKSILYSVAAPGSSQHLSLLAFDVSEYEDEAAAGVLNRHGWFRTVVNDLPHFTYLGHVENSLPSLGLKKSAREAGGRSYDYWVPDL